MAGAAEVAAVAAVVACARARQAFAGARHADAEAHHTAAEARRADARASHAVVRARHAVVQETGRAVHPSCARPSPQSAAGAGKPASRSVYRPGADPTAAVNRCGRGRCRADRRAGHGLASDPWHPVVCRRHPRSESHVRGHARHGGRGRGYGCVSMGGEAGCGGACLTSSEGGLTGRTAGMHNSFVLDIHGGCIPHLYWTCMEEGTH